ncbi:sugar phosphate permease [Novosphingobium kunmingense]|uniref:Sugar phosphate permease n=2 Tax=Novosphingobium kunmingense TaxID=1211806 RepID=A0A2N0H718_9SPHN|nr:MFS transporter [Novosphingobium kunmingense]PKB14739.1 sugar phosphate permease [Novosphingobium kunmingense]
MNRADPPSPDAMAQPAASAPVTTTTLPTGRLVLLYLVMLVTAAGNTAMQSVMPSIGTALKVEDFWISLAYTWSALLWMTCAPMWARRSDRRGRKAMMAIGLIGFISSFALCGLTLYLGLHGFLGGAATLLTFALCRSLYGGFGSAAPPAVQAYVASRTSRAERTKALSLISSSFGLGTVLGPALAPLLILPALGLVSPFLAFALIGVAVLVALRLRLPDDTPAFAGRGDIMAAPFSANSNSSARERGDPDEAHGDAETGALPTDVAKLSWFDHRLRPWLVAGLVGGHAQAAVMGIVGFLILDRLGLRADPAAGAGPIGLVLMAGAMATLLAQWGVIPLFQLGPRSSCLSGMVIAAIGTALLAVAGDLHTITLGVALASMGFGLFRPGFTAGASLAVTRAEQGQSAGIVASVNGAAYIVAPALGVWLYGHSPAVGFAVIELLCAAVIVLGLRGMSRDEVLIKPR